MFGNTKQCKQKCIFTGGNYSGSTHQFTREITITISFAWKSLNNTRCNFSITD